MLDLPLVWHVSSPLPEDAILFAGLFDDSGQRWAQSDERPLGSGYPPAAWPAGAVVRTPLRFSVPAGTVPDDYRLEVGWYRFVDGQPVWLPWFSGERLVLGEVKVQPPEDWSALAPPPVSLPIGVTVGEGLQLLGLDAAALEGYPGDTLRVDLVWQALADDPEPGQAVLQLADDAGNLFSEFTAPLAGGRASFAGLRAGQTVRDPRSLTLPDTLPPGVYTVRLGRRAPDGNWLPIRRGAFALGSTYPLITVRVLDHALTLTPPATQKHGDAHLLTSLNHRDEPVGDGLLPTESPRWKVLRLFDRASRPMYNWE
jgi:hypothetical protein